MTVPEPSNADLHASPEIVQQYVRALEEEASTAQSRGGIHPGDLLKLKGSWIQMAVEGVLGDMVFCVWMSTTGELQRAKFHPDMLEGS